MLAMCFLETFEGEEGLALRDEIVRELAVDDPEHRKEDKDSHGDKCTFELVNEMVTPRDGPTTAMLSNI